MEGVHRFLARTFRVFEPGMTEDAPTEGQMRLLHATIKKVDADHEREIGSRCMLFARWYLGAPPADGCNHPCATLYVPSLPPTCSYTTMGVKAPV